MTSYNLNPQFIFFFHEILPAYVFSYLDYEKNINFESVGQKKLKKQLCFSGKLH